MFKIKETETYAKWLAGLKDRAARVRIVRRMERLEDGNAGDAKLLGGGIYELRINYARGYRIYYMRKGAQIIILLAGGNKATQSEDIQKARRLARNFKEMHND
jgi:putative addiction module killer protein